jgi:hypothetical protein
LSISRIGDMKRLRAGEVVGRGGATGLALAKRGVHSPLGRTGAYELVSLNGHESRPPGVKQYSRLTPTAESSQDPDPQLIQDPLRPKENVCLEKQDNFIYPVQKISK